MRALEYILAEIGITTRIAGYGGRSRAVLAFHNVRPQDCAEAGDRSLHMPADAFAELVSRLRKYAEVVSLAEILEHSSRDRALRVAITFDDAYVGAIEHGIDILNATDCASTVFVAPGILGANNTWWDAAAVRFGGETPPRQREEWIDGVTAGRGDAIRLTNGTLNEVALPRAYGIADRATLERLSRSRYVALASHTWSHVNLAALATAAQTDPVLHGQLVEELQRPIVWLRENATNSSKMLAYPYGRCNLAAMRAAEDAGYDAAFRVEGGALLAGAFSANRFALPRINVPATMHASGVLTRMSGLRR